MVRLCRGSEPLKSALLRCSDVRIFGPAFGAHQHTPCSSSPRSRPVTRACGCERQQKAHQECSRRSILRGACSLSMLTATLPVAAAAAEAQPSELPKKYTELIRKLVDALKGSIEIDKPGTEDREVRRKAEPAKDLVKQWVQEWRDSAQVKGSVPQQEITATLQELGEWYTKQGQRARLSAELRERLLGRLTSAEAGLPPRPKK